MNYLLYGTEKFLIDKEIKNIINKHKIEDINISKYDLEINPKKPSLSIKEGAGVFVISDVIGFS